MIWEKLFIVECVKYTHIYHILDNLFVLVVI